MKPRPSPKPAPEPPRRRYTIGYESTDTIYSEADGSTAEATVTIDKLEPLEDAIHNGYRISCFEGEISRAAVMPGEAVLTNTTPKFTVDLSMALEIKEAIGDPMVDAEAGDCRQGASFLERKETPPGQSLGPITFGIVFPNYYSPRIPNGDASATEGWQLSIGDTFLEATCISGPGVGEGAQIPIDEKEDLGSGRGEGRLPHC